ncbi:CAP domain-containing protein [Deefgea rivuli]|uniref:CAP domain-containing protein n=1 Tax=Deefgea rivuli TaxID=400948 RepID=UPI000482EE6D|nr:CAP domain-containing protein [Deefgea rivuli]
MKLRLIAIVVSNLLLAACGGGGSSTPESPVTTAKPTADPTATAVPGVTPIPVGVNIAPTPKPETLIQAEAAGVQMLNAARTSCGFDALVNDAVLKVAVDGAGNYFKLRYAEALFAYGHYQAAGSTGFTGATPSDRAQTAGYPTLIGWAGPRVYENLSTSIAPTGYTFYSKVDAAEAMTEDLLNTVYHQLSLIAPMREVGASYVEASYIEGTAPKEITRQGSSIAHRITFNTGTRTATDGAASGSNTVLSYPCQGSEIPATFKPSLESPNPMLDVGSKVVGSPIGLRAPTGTTLDITSYSVQNQAAQILASRLLTRTKDSMISGNNASIVPEEALEVGKTYRVTAQGTFSGNGFAVTPFSIDFTFKTRAARQNNLVKKV